jgi:hypothetical protein
VQQLDTTKNRSRRRAELQKIVLASAHAVEVPPPRPARKRKRSAATVIVCLRTELRHKQDFVGRLEYLLHQRTEMIDALHGRIDQLRTVNQRLEQECEHLADIIRLAPPLDTVMLAPK